MTKQDDCDNCKHECLICKGRKEDFGTSNNKIKVMMPEKWKTQRSSRIFEIDSCMLKELIYLWKNNVRTIECCCGHGVTEGYIAVSEESIEKMIQLNYKHTKLKSNRRELFVPLNISSHKRAYNE